MLSVANLKYHKMRFEIHLVNKESLGIIVTSDWKHRYMVVKGVRPNSQAYRLGIQRGDRIFEADRIIGEELTMKAMSDILRNTRHFSMTVLRKANFPYLKSNPFVSPLPTDKQQFLNFANPETYCIKGNKGHFNVYSDQESSRKDDTEMRMESSEQDWEAMSIHTSCSSEQDHFDRQRMENMRTKFADLTNRFRNSQQRSVSVCKSFQSRGSVQENLNAMHERANKGEQFMRRYQASNVENCPISRVNDWVTRQPNFTPVVDGENKENIMPMPFNFWKTKWKYLCIRLDFIPVLLFF